jgi:Mg2+ and Co2+ transporter CorA
MENSTAIGTVIHCNSVAYLQGYVDFSSWPDNPTAQSLEDFSGPPRRSIFDDIIFLWKHASSPDDIAMAISDPRSSAVIAKRVIASSWLAYLEFVTGTTSQLETKLWAFESIKFEQPSDADQRDIAELRSLLKSVNRWRRRTWWYIDHMRWNLEALRQPTSGKEGSPEDFAWNGDHSIEDFSALHERLQYCKDRMESLMPVVMGAFSLLEAQQRAMETKHLTFLTTLATIFLLLSFSTGLFSMSGDYSPGERHFGIFWAVSLSLVALVFASVYVAKYTRSGRRQLSP